MTNKVNRVVIVGTGFVGSSYAYSLVNQSITEELVLIDMDINKAKGEAMDINHGQYFYNSPTKVWSGDYSDCKDADIVCITAGISQNQEETRISGVKKNTEIAKSIVENVMESGFNGIFLISSNPVDVITYAVWKFSGLPKERVIGSGTLLDTSRYLFELGKYFNIDARNIDGYIVGEHGDSQVAALSSTTICGKSILDIIEADEKYNVADFEDIAIKVRDVADVVIGYKGSTYYGIGAALARLTTAILNNENTILPVSVYLNGEYGFYDVYAGAPAVINRNGIKQIIEIELDSKEKDSLMSSIKLLKDTMKTLTFN